MVMFCGNCGNKVILNQQRFCTSCGKSLENQDAEEKDLAFPDSAPPEITSSVNEVSVSIEEPEEEHLSSYEFPPSEVFADTCESTPSDIESESELIYNVFDELDVIQTGRPIEQDIPAALSLYDKDKLYKPEVNKKTSILRRIPKATKDIGADVVRMLKSEHKADELLKWNKLLVKGAITQEEYEKAKRDLLS